MPFFIPNDQFVCAIFKTKFSNECPKHKDIITQIKKIPCKIATAANLA